MTAGTKETLAIWYIYGEWCHFRHCLGAASLSHGCHVLFGSYLRTPSIHTSSHFPSPFFRAQVFLGGDHLGLGYCSFSP